MPPGVAGGVKDGERREAGTAVVTSVSCSVVLLAGLARFLLFAAAAGRTGLRGWREQPLAA